MAGDGGAEAVAPDQDLDPVPELGGQPGQGGPGVCHAGLLGGRDVGRVSVSPVIHSQHVVTEAEQLLVETNPEIKIMNQKL